MDRSPFGVEHVPISKAGWMGAALYGGSGQPKNVSEKVMHGVSTAKKVKAQGLGALKGGRERRVKSATKQLEAFQVKAAANKKLIATPLKDRPR